MNRARAPLIVLGLLTAIQAGTGIWRIDVMFQEALRVGPTPFALSAGFFEEIGLSAAIAVCAWWWLPRREPSASGWALRFLAIAWVLALGQMGWVFVSGYFEHGITWMLLGLIFLLGPVLRVRVKDESSQAPPPAETPPSLRHPALAGAVFFWLLQVPHLFFPYHWTDTKDIWACRVVAFEHRGDLSGIFDCLDPGRPPLHSLILWLGHTNLTMEGRLLPLLMLGAFGLVMYRLLRQSVPRVAPWAILWFFMTVRVYQGSVSNYADVSTMIAITVALVMSTGEPQVRSRWLAIVIAAVAAMSAALIKRDGGALIFVGSAVILWFAPRRLNPQLYGAALGAVIGLGIWTMRPRDLYVPDVYAPVSAALAMPTPALPLVAPGSVSQSHSAASDTVAPDWMKVTPKSYLTMLYGMQGQVLSHYGYCMFVPAWIIVAVWVRRRRDRLLPPGRLWGWLGIAGWLAIVGIYFVHVSTGHPERGTLFVIRTAFGRHLLHMFAFALLSAAAFANVLLDSHSTDQVPA